MEKIQQYLEHTLLSPTAAYEDYDRLVAEAKTYHFFGVCVPPYWVKKVKRDLRNTAVQVVTVIGFPLGYQRTETKLDEVKYALRDGADELDVVLNLSAVKSRAWDWVKIELARLAESIHQAEKIFKLILETAYLDDDELHKLCSMCAACGVDYAKTSTGFAPKGAEIETVRKMRQWLPAHVGIKASGGIRNFAQAQAFIEAGADRIGTSSGVRIVEESLRQSNA